MKKGARSFGPPLFVVGVPKDESRRAGFHAKQPRNEAGLPAAASLVGRLLPRSKKVQASVPWGRLRFSSRRPMLKGNYCSRTVFLKRKILATSSFHSLSFLTNRTTLFFIRFLGGW
ncbi:hypothetical protein B4113_3718 [Geobacillus sp. B4113_201601]|nr:hypothetical protein B4113_3718 [Geobacillus sp. B4113_201601]